MLPKQEGHLANLKHQIASLVDGKYRRGQVEHGGDLWQKGKVELLDNAIDEAIDQMVYLLTLKDIILEAPPAGAVIPALEVL